MADNFLSQRALKLKPSPTLALVAKAKELSAKGHPVISLTVGEPDWPTFKSASDAGIVAIQKGMTKYTAAQGTIELRKIIAKKLKQEVGIDYQPNQISVGSGAKFIVFAALQSLLNPGEEVLMNSPYWVSYPTMIELADGVPHIVECNEDKNFKLLAADMEAHINKKTKAFLFCSPSNPTGLAYTKAELTDIAAVLRKHPQIVIISDDMYNRLMFDGSEVAPHLLHVAPDLQDRTIVVNGGSKTYSMTGWRIGWAAGPAKIITAMADYQSQATGCPSSIAQYAVQVAIENSEADIKEVVKTLIARKVTSIAALRAVPGFKVAEPQGAFYFWVDIKAHFGKIHKGKKIIGAKEFCEVLLDDYFVATVPGTECGTEGYMRLSFATDEKLILQAVDRMREMISHLS